MAAIETRSVRGFSSLRHSAFRYFWLGTIFLSLGVWVVQVGQMWLVQELTGSPLSLGVVGFFWSLPVLVFSLLGGVVADRVQRVRLIMVNRVIALFLALAIAVLTTTGLVQVWHIMGFAFMTGLVMAFDIPCRQALMPSLVDKKDLMNAVSLHSAVWSSTNVVGPALAGALIALLGIDGCFYLAVGAYAAATLSFSRIRRSAASDAFREAREGVLPSFVRGVRYIIGHRMILTVLVLTTLSNVLGMSFTALLPSFADQILQGDASTYGALLSAMGVGAVIGAATLAIWGDFQPKGRALIGATVLLGLLLLVLSLTRSLTYALPVLAVIGVVSTIGWTLSNTLVQLLADDEVRGRVMSVYIMTWGMMSFGNLMIGALGSAWGVPVAIAFGGVLSVASTLLVVARAPRLLSLS
jgi:MFS family permease